MSVQSDYDDTPDSTDKKLHTGMWKWQSYILKGKRQASFVSHCPETVAILDQANLMTDTPFSFAFFSTMGPGAKIASHYGPCNLRLRVHLPLIVPASGTPKCPASAPLSPGPPHASPTGPSGPQKKKQQEGEGQGGGSEEEEASTVGMRVGGEKILWKAGQPVFFDDSYSHHVWNNTSGERVLLLFDLWHPCLLPAEIEAIKGMFGYASDQGWLKKE